MGFLGVEGLHRLVCLVEPALDLGIPRKTVALDIAPIREQIRLRNSLVDIPREIGPGCHVEVRCFTGNHELTCGSPQAVAVCTRRGNGFGRRQQSSAAKIGASLLFADDLSS